MVSSITEQKNLKKITNRPQNEIDFLCLNGYNATTMLLHY